MKRYSRKKKKSDLINHIILKQVDEINELQKKISNLEINCAEKDEIVNSIDSLNSDLFNIVNELKQKSEEYDSLISDLKEMKKTINQTVFKGRWNLIRLLIK